MVKVNKKVRLKHVGHSLSSSSLCRLAAFLAQIVIGIKIRFTNYTSLISFHDRLEVIFPQEGGCNMEELYKLFF